MENLTQDFSSSSLRDFDKTMPIGFFDSGIGGISVMQECRKLLPNENFIYFADSKNAPYGNKTSKEILDRVTTCSEILLEQGCKAIVIACNTATNVGVKLLREKYLCPFVGIEPAIKPAVKEHKGGKILLLCTNATSKQEKFVELLSKYNNGDVIVAPQCDLAMDIEKNIENLSKIKSRVFSILDDYRNVSSVILGCTHYYFIKDFLNEYYNNEVTIFDGNLGAAKRLKTLLQTQDLMTTSKKCGEISFLIE